MPLIQLRVGSPIIATSRGGLFGPMPGMMPRRLGGVFPYNAPTTDSGESFVFRPGCFWKSLPQAVLCWNHDRNRQLADETLTFWDGPTALSFNADLEPWADAEYELVRGGFVRGLSLTCEYQRSDTSRTVGGATAIHKAKLIEVSPVAAGAVREATVGILPDNPSRDEFSLRLLAQQRRLELLDPSYRRPLPPRTFGPSQPATRPRGQPFFTSCGGGLFGGLA